MRVLMVPPSYYPVKGGTEIMVRNLSIELNKMKIHTDVMTFNLKSKWNPKWQGKKEEIDGLTVFRIPALNCLPTKPSPRITFGVNLIPGRFMHIMKKYDIIHFHEADFSFPLFSFLTNAPKIMHLHGLQYLEHLHGLQYHLSRTIMKHIAHLYICISRQMEKKLEELGIPKYKTTYLPNGVDTELFRPCEEKEDNLILFVGRIAFNKGLHVLLQSLRYIRKPVHLVIIGPPWNLKYHEDIIKHIENKNQNGRHEIEYRGELDPAHIIEWYQRASLFVLPSFVEAFPMVTLEALSCETPVVATSVGGVPEVVKSGESGVLVPVNNPVKLAQAVQHLLDNEDLRKRFGHNGRQLIVKEFSLRVIAKKLNRIYCAMLDSAHV